MSLRNFFILALVFIAQLDLAFAEERSSWSVGAYWGKSNQADILELTRARFEKWESYSILGLTARKDLWKVPGYFAFEWHNHLVFHFEKWGLIEGVEALSFTWKWFPWSRWVSSSLAFGDGVSVASDYPSSESVEQKIYTRLMNYLVCEFRAEVPGAPEFELLLKVHHRSAVYGLIQDFRGGSNYVSAGMMWRLP